MIKNILITGSTGFLGKNLLDVPTSHNIFSPSKSELNIFNLSELVDYLLENKIDSIVHLAALCGGIGINSHNSGVFMYTNLQLGMNIMEAARVCDIEKVVNIGTVCSYPKYTEIPFKESDLWLGYPEETNSAYGIAKKTIMELGIAYGKQYGLNVTNLIPVNMCGPYDNFDLYSSHVIPALIAKFESNKDEVVLWGDGSASREFLDARDCARAIMKSVDMPTGSDPINIGTGREVSIKDLALLVKDIGNYTANITWDTSKPNGQPRRCLDISRAKSLLGWKPLISLEESIRDTIEFYRDKK